MFYILECIFTICLVYTLHTNIHAQLSLEGGFIMTSQLPVLGDINTCVVLLNRGRSQLSTDTKPAHITVFCVVVRQGTTRKVERGFSLSTSGSTDSDQTAPRADSNNVYVQDHILKNMEPIELGFVATSLLRLYL